MKKILFAVLMLSLLLALCACGDTGAAEPASATTPAPTAETAVVTVPDENAEEQLTVGTLRQDAEGATYENPLLGFGCRLDTSWYVATKEQLYYNPMHPYTEFLLDAIPQADPHRRDDERRILTGEIPSPVNPPSGCYFHTRCPYATKECRTTAPTLRDFGDGHLAACHRCREFFGDNM